MHTVKEHAMTLFSSICAVWRFVLRCDFYMRIVTCYFTLRTFAQSKDMSATSKQGHECKPQNKDITPKQGHECNPKARTQVQPQSNDWVQLQSKDISETLEQGRECDPKVRTWVQPKSNYMSATQKQEHEYSPKARSWVQPKSKNTSPTPKQGHGCNPKGRTRVQPKARIWVQPQSKDMSAKDKNNIISSQRKYPNIHVYFLVLFMMNLHVHASRFDRSLFPDWNLSVLCTRVHSAKVAQSPASNLQPGPFICGIFVNGYTFPRFSSVKYQITTITQFTISPFTTIYILKYCLHEGPSVISALL